MNQPGTGPAPVLAGENGAGRSTLVKALAGVRRPDTGQVLPGGAPVDFHGPPAVFGRKNIDESDF